MNPRRSQSPALLASKVLHLGLLVTGLLFSQPAFGQDAKPVADAQSAAPSGGASTAGGSSIGSSGAATSPSAGADAGSDAGSEAGAGAGAGSAAGDGEVSGLPEGMNGSDRKIGPLLGSPAGSPFGRIGPYDLVRPAESGWWPQLRGGLGTRHVETEGGSSKTQHFARAGVAANLWQLSFNLEADFIFDDEGQPIDVLYNDFNDYLSIVKFIEWGNNGDTFHARAGVLADATIGHGTIVGHYYNNTVFGQPRTGLAAEVNLRFLGFQGLTNDVTNGEVMAGRVIYKPLLDTKIPFIRNLAVGTSLAMDRRAPDKLRFRGDGRFSFNGDDEARASREQLSIFGVDLELPIINNSWVSLVPYADQNFISSYGNGLHAGVMAHLRLPIHIPTTVRVRGEYRRFQDEYLPTYFDAFYEFERYHYPRTDSFTTKFQNIRLASERNGFLGELAFDFARSLQVGAIYEQSQGKLSNRLDAYVAFTGLDWLLLRVHYQKRGFTELDEIGDWDEQTFLSAQALVQIYGYLYADLRWTRYWELDQASGRYRAIDVIDPSLALIVQF